MRSRSSITLQLVMVVTLATTASPDDTPIARPRSSAATVPLPNQPDSLKFAVLGDSGTGDKAQYELADQMATLHDRFKYSVVLLLGGNVHDGERPRDFMKKFEAPYKRLLQGGVTFHAALGNEDAKEQRY
jgi:hypothetical protein